jgi:DNA-binding transcriptional regulator YiaG
MVYSRLRAQANMRFTQLSRVEHLTAPFCFDAAAPSSIASNRFRRTAFRTLGSGSSLRDCHFLRHVTDLVHQMNHDSTDPKQKRERFQQLTQNPKVKIGKVFAADVRKSKIHPTVKKLTAWRKANRLSQPKAVAVLGQYYFHITFASLRSWEEGRRSPNPHTAGILDKFLSDHPTVERPKK